MRGTKRLSRAACAAIALAVCGALLAACRERPHETVDFVMGTVVRQTVYGPSAETAAREAVERLRALEAALSFHDAASDISRLNRSSGGPQVTLGPEAIGLLERSLEFSRMSDGAFNIMVGPLVRRWKVTADRPDVPPPAEIASLVRLASYRDLSVDRDRRTARLARRGQMADLGGIAKGYASDAVLALYRARGVRSAIIDIGGNIGLLGSRPDGRPWNIGVQDPGRERGSYIGYLSLADNSVSTSGGYERFFVAGGRRYSHIIDPRTGYPADSGLASASVVAPSAEESDALSTAVFVLGASKGIGLIQRRPGVEAVCITTDGTVIVTEGLRGRFTLTAPEGTYRVEYRYRVGPDAAGPARQR